MVFTTRNVACCLAILFLTTASMNARTASHIALNYRQVASDPKATFRQYLQATRRNDVQAAMKYWVFDEEKPSKSLEVIVGMWISMRQINQVAERKFGAEGLQSILKGWWRDDITDAAIDQTLKDLESALVRSEGNHSRLIFTNNQNKPWFKPSEDIHFRKLNGQWKLDANMMTGLKRGDNFFAEGTWGPLFRDQIVIMNEAVDQVEKGKILSKKELGDFINKSIDDVRKQQK